MYSIVILQAICPSSVFPKIFLLADSFRFRKVTADPHILVHVTVVCPDDR